MSIADDWARRKRRTAWLALIATLALTIAAYFLATLPTVRKLQARRWPTAPARVVGASVVDSVGTNSALAGRRVKVTFAYRAADGTTREATQEVSDRFARGLGISDQGYLVFGRAPAAAECAYDPIRPTVAVLERSLGHADVPALIPLAVLAIGLVLADAERRAARRADDPRARATSRNDPAWAVHAAGDALSVQRKPAFEVAGMLADAIVGMPIDAVYVSPHPLRPDRAATIALSPRPMRRGGRRRVRAQLNVGRFNASGSARHAAWSAEVFDGTIGRDDAPRIAVRLPATSDLPASAVDCWLRISWRTRLGIPWSRAVWLSLADAAGR